MLIYRDLLRRYEKKTLHLSTKTNKLLKNE